MHVFFLLQNLNKLSSYLNIYAIVKFLMYLFISSNYCRNVSYLKKVARGTIF